MKKRCILLVIIFFISIIILSVNSNNKYLVKEESLATFIDGEKTDSFPAKGTVAFSKADCDNNTNIEWDNDTWGLYVTNLSNKVKCNIYFKTGENAVTKITSLASSDTTNMASDDPDNNIRYIGANPNNYVYFNCDDYNNQTSDTCELWRIIGVFNNIEKEDGTKENLIKIVRNDSIGQYSWDNKDSTTGAENNNGSSNWVNARLNYLLNPNYENEKNGGSLYFNSEAGMCYLGENNATVKCDFSKTGLKDDITRNLIQSVVWNLGGLSSSSEKMITSSLYKAERGNNVYKNNSISWTGKIGLIYPSDYGYATAGGNTVNRKFCILKELNEWNETDFNDCKLNDYLYEKKFNQWTITPEIDTSWGVYLVFATGNVGENDIGNIRPTLFLKSNISIGLGDGSLNTPYQLGI